MDPEERRRTMGDPRFWGINEFAPRYWDANNPDRWSSHIVSIPQGLWELMQAVLDEDPRPLTFGDVAIAAIRAQIPERVDPTRDLAGVDPNKPKRRASMRGERSHAMRLTLDLPDRWRVRLHELREGLRFGAAVNSLLCAHFDYPFETREPEETEHDTFMRRLAEDARAADATLAERFRVDFDE